MAPEPHARYGAFAEWLAGMHGENPYSVLAEWAAALPRRRHLVLDAGCGGGGLLARVAPAFGMALGLDRSFLAVLLARRAVLHLPEAERSYLLVLRRGEEVERPIRVERRDNAEFFVADCSALPLPDELFDAVLSCNVIDIAGIGGPLDEAARVLRPGGSLGVSAPFFFRDGHAPDGDPREAVRSRLRDRGLTLAAEKEGVPWTWATYDRHWHVYFNYCAAAVRE